MNKLYYGDNLDILQNYIQDESVDLIYLDPPFNSNATYNVLFSQQNGSDSSAQIQAFEDTWRWDENAVRTYQLTVERGGSVADALRAFRGLLGDSNMLAYLVMMAPRLVELHRVLKPTGSLYLHCDPTASHYLKVLLDQVFGVVNFRNEVVWRRVNAHNKLSKQYGPIHDIIFFYAKTVDAKFHPGYRPYSKAYIEDRFIYDDERGRYQTNYLTGPGIRNGESGKEWRGFNPSTNGRHWAIPRSLRIFLTDKEKRMGSLATLEALYKKGFIVFPKKIGGQPMYKQYVGPGVIYQDIWAYQPNTSGILFDSEEHIDEDVKYLESEEEKLGFDTQKPVGLLKRILTTSTDKGDVVLDPFCGCGTTIVAAQKLNRQWIGIDITHLAIGLIKHRMADQFGDELQYEVIGEPTTLEGAQALADQDKFQFEWWALGLVGARPADPKKGADHGIDGQLYFHDDDSGETKQVILSVKGGHTNVAHVRDLVGVLDREAAQIGVLITLREPTQPMRAEAAIAGFYESPWGKHPKVQILTIEELLNGGEIDMPPIRQVNQTYRRAPRHKGEGGKQLGLLDE